MKEKGVNDRLLGRRLALLPVNRRSVTQDHKKRPPQVTAANLWSVVRLLLLDIRAVTGDALPFSVWHFYPRIGPALIRIEWLARLIGTLALETAVAMAVSPKTVTFTSGYSTLWYLVAFATARVSARLRTFPSVLVFTN